ncbi:MAG: hypothetical protein Q8P68_02005 [Candidatus Peregrinibacteria bacterium]|nr:hypothetical protein [Candidatus Peregrinibacteria bacterium]MDZ4244534.1 hypothetical protein [Candidatus Gracilibacteria bacterium]
MENSKDTIALLKEMLDSAESSLKSARSLLIELAGGKIESTKDYASFAASMSESSTEEGTIIEGVFNGEQMIGPNEKMYPVPANYASKSKLIEGDVLKLTIKDDGKFLYKQIGPIPRKHIIGQLINDDGQYKVIVGSKSYKVLLASVTYFKATINDQITLIIPEDDNSEWGAIENVIPKA